MSRSEGLTNTNHREIASKENLELVEQLKNIETFNDGRRPLWEVYARQLELETKYGFSKEIIYTIEIDGREGQKITVPIFCFISPAATGDEEVTAIMAGIHGEEPAPPNAVINQIDNLGAMGQKRALALFPMMNPAGYYRNWRFHDQEFNLERRNVTDARHLLPSPENPDVPMINAPISAISDQVTKYLAELNNHHPFRVFIDLHEDAKLTQGYLYSQGGLAEEDPLVKRCSALMREAGVSLKSDGSTRFPHEIIKDGVVFDENGGAVHDGSIDEWAAAVRVFVDGRYVSKTGAQTVLVPETPADGSLSLETRIAGHETILKNLAELLSLSPENVIKNLIEPGLKRWQEAGARVEYLSDGPDLAVPVIIAPATGGSETESLTILAVSGMHLEETGGPNAWLQPDNFADLRSQGFNLLIVPVVNQHGLQFPETGPEKDLRRNEAGVNYNDCWGNSPRRTREADLIAARIREWRAKQPIALALSCHEDSTLPGKGYLDFQGTTPEFRNRVDAAVQATSSRTQLASFTPETNPLYLDLAEEGNYQPSPVEHGYMSIGFADDTAMENWLHDDPQLQIPCITIEGPFGLDLKTRTQFQIDLIHAALTALRSP